MVNCIKVAEYADCSGNRPYKMKLQISLVPSQWCLILFKHRKGEYNSNKISEETFLDCRQITRKAYKCVHQCETESRSDYHYYAHVFFADIIIHGCYAFTTLWNTFLPFLIITSPEISIFTDGSVILLSFTEIPPC